MSGPQSSNSRPPPPTDVWTPSCTKPPAPHNQTPPQGGALVRRRYWRPGDGQGARLFVPQRASAGDAGLHPGLLQGRPHRASAVSRGARGLRGAARGLRGAPWAARARGARQRRQAARVRRRVRAFDCWAPARPAPRPRPYPTPPARPRPARPPAARRRERARRSTAQMAADPFTLVVALGEGGLARGDLYVDDGRSFAFLRGAYMHRRWAWRPRLADRRAQAQPQRRPRLGGARHSRALGLERSAGRAPCLEAASIPALPSAQLQPPRRPPRPARPPPPRQLRVFTRPPALPRGAHRRGRPSRRARGAAPGH
jgi:hypothetical protein